MLSFFCASFVSFVFCGLYFLKKISYLRTKDFFSACHSCDLFTLKIRAHFKLPSWHLLSFWSKWSTSNRNIIIRMFGWGMVCMPHFLMISICKTTWNRDWNVLSTFFFCERFVRCSILRTLDPGPSKFGEIDFIIVHSTL